MYFFADFGLDMKFKVLVNMNFLKNLKLVFDL